MRVLVVGSGGREHALAWALRRSPQVGELFVAPGNGGTACIAMNVAIPAEDVRALADFAAAQRIDLTVVGPEVPLALGLSDALQKRGLRVFGPSAATARLESSKAFSKRFMAAHGIPTADFTVVDDYDAALRYLGAHPAPIVVKADGLAAGKGAIVCHTDAEARQALDLIMRQRAFGDAGNRVVIEECLHGQEVSVLAFSDGRTVRPMILAQDHKAIYDGDRGPNTGGMGCYAPASLLDAAMMAKPSAWPKERALPVPMERVTTDVLQRAVGAMAASGTPYVGVLYAGLMVEGDSFAVLEFNCRFGGPETQVILLLLRTDLTEVMLACVEGRLDQVPLAWNDGSCVCVVMASEGYPGTYTKGHVIEGLDAAEGCENAVVFHAGTERRDGRVLTAGGRVLGVTAWDADLPRAIERAYAAVERIHWPGATYRHDIGAKGLAKRVERGVNTGSELRVPSIGTEPATRNPEPAPRNPSGAYAAAGVDIDAGNRAVELMSRAVRATYGPEVLLGIGAFGGLYDASRLQGMRSPVLVASTDGVGTKTMVAAALGSYETVGQDIVNHCINDILVQGAEPLFFLDYIAMPKIDPDVVARIVSGVATACRAAGCALLGGETAEMPGVYAPGEMDLAGTIVGVVERDAIISGGAITPGDVLIGLPSSGLHTNGFSLVRRILSPASYGDHAAELGRPLGEALVEPHRSYLPHVRAIREVATINGLAHLTGGAFVDNIPRILPEKAAVVVRRDTWPVPPLFGLIERLGGVDHDEMYRVFNMGIGMVVVVDPCDLDAALDAVGREAHVIGEVVARSEGERVALR
jgi:phosphoribosylamine--glycine ligase/phosphoribosylaminoimidazole synthetase